MLRSLLERGEMIVAPGVYDGLSARIAASAGFEALYVSGFSVAGGTFGQPDIGLLSLDEMASAVARIVESAGDTPVIADADTGYGGPLNVARTVRRYERCGVSCIQLEDQVHPKRCGHMENKAVVSRGDAVERINAALDARSSSATLVMARTDARSTDGLDEALDRAGMFLDAGADILFIEAPASRAELRRIVRAFPGTPLVINLVEDGKTPWAERNALQEMGFKIALYPVTALLHVTANLKATYGALANDNSPATERESFGGFNELVGLARANDYMDKIRSDEPET